MPTSPIVRQARATGLEPATTGSTVRYSNQLSYAPGAEKPQNYISWSLVRKSLKGRKSRATAPPGQVAGAPQLGGAACQPIPVPAGELNF
jgi:hypothetical protein